MRRRWLLSKYWVPIFAEVVTLQQILGTHIWGGGDSSANIGSPHLGRGRLFSKYWVPTFGKGATLQQILGPHFWGGDDPSINVGYPHLGRGRGTHDSSMNIGYPHLFAICPIWPLTGKQGYFTIYSTSNKSIIKSNYHERFKEFKIKWWWILMYRMNCWTWGSRLCRSGSSLWRGVTNENIHTESQEPPL